MPTWAGIRKGLQAAAAYVAPEFVDVSDLTRETAAARLMMRREQLVQRMLPYLLVSSMIIVATSIMTAFTNTNRLVSQNQDLVAVFCFLLLFVWQWCPRMTRALGPTSVIASVMFTCTAWSIASEPSRSSVSISSALSAPPRLVLSAVFMSVWPTIFWNTIHVVATAYVNSRLPQDSDGCLNVPVFPFFEVVNLVVLIVGPVGLHRVIVHLIRMEIQHAETKSWSSAVLSLLNTVCDASVELDEHLVITNDAARLGAVLLHTSGRQLEGVHFSNLLSSAEDREKFVQHARKRAKLQQQESELADLFTAHMRDNTNNDVEVEIFLVSYTSPFGHTKFVVGIREKASDGAVSQPRELVELSFEANTFKVISRSSSFDLRGPNGSCESGDCLRQWLAPCVENEAFFTELELALRAVEHSNEPFSFTSRIVLQNLVKPGTAFVAGHRFLVNCSVHLGFEDVTVEQMDGTDRGDAAIGGLEDASTQGRTIARMKVGAIKRLRTCRTSNLASSPRTRVCL
eukprot:TRINITY_DN9571_c0_g2_i1.p1 TRINITY_DN9571_c0_g2~~TRINITY_DN9571_c0_g2_i1.p1  ORF type:complete len:573 (+),score=57.81 TRINITY_DN9571_c0_g2_i1:178-1719(+)